MSSALPLPSPNMTIDVVNHADEKVGEILRRDVLPAAKNFHTAHLFLFDQAGRLLLQQLAPTRERHALRWGASVAGYLFANETYDEAIRRRAAQELGVVVDPELVGKIEMTDQHSTKFVALFTAVSADDVTPDLGHIAAVRFETIAEIESELQQDPDRFTPTFRRLFAFYRGAHS